MRRKRRLSLEHVRALHEELGVPAEVLIQAYQCRVCAVSATRGLPRWISNELLQRLVDAGQTH